MRLLVVTPFYKPAYIYGGPPRSISALCEGLVDLGHEVTVFTTNANGNSALDIAESRPIQVDGVHVSYFVRNLPGNYFYSHGLGRACHGEVSGFDLVYVSSSWGYPFLPACRAARKGQVPYVVTPRTSFMRRTWQGKYLKKGLYHLVLERALIDKAAAIHYTTPLEVQQSKWLNLHPPTFVVPNPVSLDEFNNLPPPGSFRQKWRIPSTAEVLLFLGRIEPRKGLDLLLTAFARIVGEFPKARLVVAGPEEDDYRRILQDRAFELHVAERLVFTGYLNSTERLEALADADMFVLTSYSENFGMSAVEAMASGVPVVVSDHVGIADTVERSKAGYVASLKVESIVDALRSLLKSRDGRAQRGHNAARAARECFAPGKVAPAMAAELAQIVVRSK